MTRLMFPYLFLVGLSALAMGVLNAHRHFLLPALSPVALNIGIIIGALVLAPRLPEPVVGLGLGVLLGGAWVSSCCRFRGSATAACSRRRSSTSATLRSGGSWG